MKSTLLTICPHRFFLSNLSRFLGDWENAVTFSSVEKEQTISRNEESVGFWRKPEPPKTPVGKHFCLFNQALLFDIPHRFWLLKTSLNNAKDYELDSKETNSIEKFHMRVITNQINHFLFSIEQEVQKLQAFQESKSSGFSGFRKIEVKTNVFDLIEQSQSSVELLADDSFVVDSRWFLLQFSNRLEGAFSSFISAGLEATADIRSLSEKNKSYFQDHWNRLTEMLVNWIIPMRLLINQHQRLFHSLQPICSLEPNISIQKELQRAFSKASLLVLEKTGVSPTVNLCHPEGGSDTLLLRPVYRSWLSYSLTELAKNSLFASYLLHHTKDQGVYDSSGGIVETVVRSNPHEKQIEIIIMNECPANFGHEEFEAAQNFFMTTKTKQNPTYTYSGNFGGSVRG